MKDYKKLTNVHFDVLREFGNVGAGNAATSLSSLLNQRIDLMIPSANAVPFNQMANFIGGEEEVVFAIFIRILGDIEGNLFLLLKEESAINLLSNTTDFKNRRGFNEYDLSVLKEIANILCGSYVTSMSDLSNLKLQLTTPELQKDTISSILNFGVLEYGAIGDEAILLNTSFLQNQEQIQGYFLFLPSPHSFETLFSSLGIDF